MFILSASEIDPYSLDFARRNVMNNDLEDRIRIFDASPTRIFGPLFDDEHMHQSEATLRVDFTMCNPPFYSSKEEIDISKDVKESAPLSVRHLSRVRGSTLTQPRSDLHRIIERNDI